MEGSCKKCFQHLLHMLHIQGASGVQFCRDSLSNGFQTAVGLQIERLGGHDDRIPDGSAESRYCLSCPLWIAVQPFHSHSGVHALVRP